MDDRPPSQVANTHLGVNPKVLSIASYAVVAAAIAGLYFTHALLARTLAVQFVQGAAVVLMVLARITFGTRSFHFAANATQGGLIPFVW